MTIKYTKRARKELDQMNEPHKTRIDTAINYLPNGDVRKYEGRRGAKRLRVGSYRVIFSYTADNNILIEKVEPRGQVYKGGN
jgi:mRNA interferase RelE/StbE